MTAAGPYSSDFALTNALEDLNNMHVTVPWMRSVVTRMIDSGGESMRSMSAVLNGLESGMGVAVTTTLAYTGDRLGITLLYPNIRELGDAHTSQYLAVSSAAVCALQDDLTVLGTAMPGFVTALQEIVASRSTTTIATVAAPLANAPASVIPSDHAQWLKKNHFFLYVLTDANQLPVYAVSRQLRVLSWRGASFRVLPCTGVYWRVPACRPVVSCRVVSPSTSTRHYAVTSQAPGHLSVYTLVGTAQLTNDRDVMVYNPIPGALPAANSFILLVIVKRGSTSAATEVIGSVRPAPCTRSLPQCRVTSLGAVRMRVRGCAYACALSTCSTRRVCAALRRVSPCPTDRKPTSSSRTTPRRLTARARVRQ